MPPTSDSTFNCVGGVLLATSAAEGIGALGEGIPAALAAGAITTGGLLFVAFIGIAAIAAFSYGIYLSATSC